ncbi:hypothetical protein CEXT_497911 [Caerostris extrusa]|uniref:Uncharacterized protein n=1 Tax=Caerostris extrusa TaxID=172846 RepID=A0AAV4TFS6_CAEEX|nr:hypothetical protein CEXT_497911 [Caerostris extrusa]
MKELALLFSRAEFSHIFPETPEMFPFFPGLPRFESNIRIRRSTYPDLWFYPIFRLSAIAYCRVYWSFGCRTGFDATGICSNQKSAQGTELGS